MEMNKQKPKENFKIIIILPLFHAVSILTGVLSDIAYPISLRGNRATSDMLNRLSTTIEKKSLSLKQK